MFFKKTKGKPTAIDLYIGKRIKVRRSLMGMSQQKLGNEIGVTFQQIQKYEIGKNRVAAGRLYAIASVLQVPFDYFVMEFEKSGKAKS